MTKKFIFSFFIPILLLIFFFIYLQNNEVKKTSIKNCNNLSYDESLFLHPKNFAKFELELVFPSEKSWRRHVIETDLEAKNNEEKYGLKFYKNLKRVDAIFEISLKKNLKCFLEARVRPHGLLQDHRDTSESLPSLNVTLKNGNFFGITKFILFRPHTRYWDNEIFVSTLLKDLGFISPRTTKITLTYKNEKKDFLFQERIVKELLESNYFREGPLYEGDNRFSILFSENQERFDISKHKLMNEKWSLNSSSKMSMSQQGLSILNKSNENYKDTLKNPKTIPPSDYFTLEKKKFSTSYFENYDVYDAINFAIKTEHGLSSDDRTYYYDPFYKKFHPIYWDGMSYLLDGYNYNFGNFTEYKQLITPSAKNGAANALNLLKNVDLELLEKNLKKKGLKLDNKNLKEIFSKIEKNILKIKSLDNENLVNIKLNENSDNEFNKSLELKIRNLRLIFYDDEFSNFLLCEYYANQCIEKKLNNLEIAKMLNQKLKINQNDILFMGKNTSKDKKIKWFHEHFDKISLAKGRQLVKFDQAHFAVMGDVNYKVDEVQKTIIFEKKSKFGNVTFFKGKIDNWKIQFDNKDLRPYPGVDENNLTGCLNFYDVEITDIILDLKNSNCEDSVNFVRSTGTIKDVKIFNSRFDSIDADFSNLIFRNINISKSNNDCVDLSFGNYSIDNMDLTFCGDKAISIGETSEVKIKKGNIINSNTGVAVKDYSYAILDQININKVEYCYQVYNKKAEFAGAFLGIDRSSCNNSKNIKKVDSRSKLEIKNEL